MNGVVRSAESPSSKFSGQRRRVQILGNFPLLLLSFLFYGLFSLHAQVIDAVTEMKIIQLGVRKGIPAYITKQLMIEESSKRSDAVSHKTAEGFQSRGLFQLYDRPSNLQWLLSKYWKYNRLFNIYDPFDNAEVALSYLADLYRNLGSWYAALCFYNYGSTENVPSITRAYVLRILRARKELHK